MRRDEWVTVQGPVTKQQPDGLSQGGGGGQTPRNSPILGLFNTFHCLPEEHFSDLVWVGGWVGRGWPGPHMPPPPPGGGGVSQQWPAGDADLFLLKTQISVSTRKHPPVH